MKPSNLARQVAFSLLCVGLGASGAAHAQAPDSYPNPSTPITLIVGAGPGGATELVARFVADVLTQRLKAVAVVEFKPGAGGAVGAEYVARSKPNGYTLLVASQSGLSVLPHVVKNIKYDVARDFEPITLVGSSPMVLLASADSKITSPAELIRQIKASPGKLAFGTSGDGTSLHLAAASFLNEIGGTGTHVPYKGAGAALIGLGTGSTQFMFDIMPTAMAFTKTGKAVPLAVTTTTRSKSAPELPTLQEAGVPGYTWATWLGVVAPAGTPTRILDVLNEALVSAVKSPDNAARLNNVGLEPQPMARKEFGDFIAKESARFGAIVRKNAITAE